MTNMEIISKLKKVNGQLNQLTIEIGEIVSELFKKFDEYEDIIEKLQIEKNTKDNLIPTNLSNKYRADKYKPSLTSYKDREKF